MSENSLNLSIDIKSLECTCRQNHKVQREEVIEEDLGNLVQIFWKLYPRVPIDFHQFVYATQCRLRVTCDQMCAYSKRIHLMSLHLPNSPIPRKDERSSHVRPHSVSGDQEQSERDLPHTMICELTIELTIWILGLLHLTRTYSRGQVVESYRYLPAYW
jgi:hypothetical protein